MPNYHIIEPDDHDQETIEDQDTEGYAEQQEYHIDLFNHSSNGNLDGVKMVLSFLDQTAINISNSDGLTPLHLAAEEGHIDLIEFLMCRGANVGIRDNAGKTAGDYLKNWAEQTDNLDTASQMLDEIEEALIGQNNYSNYNYIPEN